MVVGVARRGRKEDVVGEGIWAVWRERLCVESGGGGGGEGGWAVDVGGEGRLRL